VDDAEMGITHILRGEDHVTNTAVQVQIMEAFTGSPVAMQFGHLALISGAQGEGLSKREGSLSLKELRAEGIEPMAINSVLARLGTSEPVVPCTILDEVVENFNIHTFGRATPKLGPDDLWLMNEKVLHLFSFDQVKSRLAAIGLDGVTSAFWDFARNNIKQLTDVKEWWEICYGEVVFPEPQHAALLTCAKDCLPEEPWDAGSFDDWIGQVKEKSGLKGKDLFIPLRRALTGQEHGPELRELFLIMGHGQVKRRLQMARSQ
jgi:glutamyl-tRNA synthetase